MEKYHAISGLDLDIGGDLGESSVPSPRGTKWIADPFNSEMVFSIKHLQLMEIKGNLKDFSVTAYGTAPDFKDLNVLVEMKPESLDTGNPEQDKEVLKLFRTDKFPLIRFESNEVEWKHFNEFLLYGELTIKGITQPITLEGKMEEYEEQDPMGLSRAKFTIEGDINRKLFRLVWENENVVKVLSNNVKLKGRIELTPPRLLDIYRKMNIPVK